MKTPKRRAADRPYMTLPSGNRMAVLSEAQLDQLHAKVSAMRAARQVDRKGINLSLRPDNTPIRVLDINGNPKCLS